MSGHEPCIGYTLLLSKDFLPAVQLFFRHDTRNNMQKDEIRL